MSEALTIAVIEALGQIVGAMVTVGGLIFIGLHITQRSRELQKELPRILRDLKTLYMIEQVHVEMTVGRGEPANKVKVRKLVEDEKGLRLSGRYTPARIDDLIQKADIDVG